MPIRYEQLERQMLRIIIAIIIIFNLFGFAVSFARNYSRAVRRTSKSGK
jgi:hypothetical protein